MTGQNCFTDIFYNHQGKNARKGPKQRHGEPGLTLPGKDYRQQKVFSDFSPINCIKRYKASHL